MWIIGRAHVSCDTERDDGCYTGLQASERTLIQVHAVRLQRLEAPVQRLQDFALRVLFLCRARVRAELSANDHRRTAVAISQHLPVHPRMPHSGR